MKAIVFESDEVLAEKVKSVLTKRNVVAEVVATAKQLKKVVSLDTDRVIKCVVSGIEVGQEDDGEAAHFLKEKRPDIEHFGVATVFRDECTVGTEKVLLDGLGEIEARIFQPEQGIDI